MNAATKGFKRRGYLVIAAVPGGVLAGTLMILDSFQATGAQNPASVGFAAFVVSVLVSEDSEGRGPLFTIASLGVVSGWLAIAVALLVNAAGAR